MLSDEPIVLAAITDKLDPNVACPRTLMFEPMRAV
jgi:hypothetical protein